MHIAERVCGGATGALKIKMQEKIWDKNQKF